MSDSFKLQPSQTSASFMTTENVDSIHRRCREELSKYFRQVIPIDRNGVIMTMQSVMNQRVETDEEMAIRVVMTIVNQARNHYLERKKHMNWEENYVNSQQIFDLHGRKGPVNSASFKLRDSYRGSRVGGTLRFHSV